MQSISTVFKHVKRDALAGTVAGIMEVPLTVGICLMSDYPIMTGLYTVIFAGLISFVTFLLKPGNFTGMPGVAAGLAPALALGVHTFGMENMPFVIVLTAVFQMLVWKLGIFEGLLLLLLVYAMILFLFMKRLGKSNAEVWTRFKMIFQDGLPSIDLERQDILNEPSVPVLDKFQQAVNDYSLDQLMKLSCEDAILIPAFSTKFKRGKAQI